MREQPVLHSSRSTAEIKADIDKNLAVLNQRLESASIINFGIPNTWVRKHAPHNIDINKVPRINENEISERVERLLRKDNQTLRPDQRQQVYDELGHTDVSDDDIRAILRQLNEADTEVTGGEDDEDAMVRAISAGKKKSKRVPRQPKISQEMVNKKIKAHKFAQPHSLKKELPPLKNTKSVESLGQVISKKVPLPGSTFQGSKGTGMLRSHSQPELSGDALEIFKELSMGERGRGPRKIIGPHLKDHVADLYRNKTKLASTFQMSYTAGPLYDYEVENRDNAYCMKRDDFKTFVEEWVKFQNQCKGGK